MQPIAIALMLATSCTLTLVESAQAGFVSLFSRNTGGRPSGRSRGGATRDSACAPTATTAPNTTASFPELVALVPNSLQKTSQAKPDFFVYVPFNRQEHNQLALVFELARKPTPSSRQPLLAPQIVPLPEQPGLVQFQLPAEISLETDQIYEWTFHLSCQQNSLIQASPLSQSDSPPETQISEQSNTHHGGDHRGELDIHQIKISQLNQAPNLTLNPALNSGPQGPYLRSTIRQEIYGEIQRVRDPEAAQRLTEALVEASPEERLQAYQEIDLWFDLVAELSTRRVPDWGLLLQEFDLAPSLKPVTLTKL